VLNREKNRVASSGWRQSKNIFWERNMSLFTYSAPHTVALSALFLVCSALTPVTASAQNESPREDADEIVVTATRRDVKISDIPLSISALAQDTLTTRGVRDSSDIAYIAPGLAVVSNNDGAETISVRGIVAIGSVPTTAFYIDETPISQAVGGTFSPRYFDIERVEVLRGPQGTLFGASAMGGAIRVITKRPSLSRFEGTFRAEGSTTRLGSENYVIDGAVSVPIVSDILALRVTGFYEKQAGWVKSLNPVFSDNPGDYIGLNPATGSIATGVAYQGVTGTVKRIGDQTVYGGRAALLFQPVDSVKLTATYHWQERENDGANNADRSTTLMLPGSDFRQARSYAEFRIVRSRLANLTAELDANFAKLTSSTSYEWAKVGGQSDVSAGLFGDVVGAFGAAPRDAGGQAGAASSIQQKKNKFYTRSTSCFIRRWTP
jgi:iron complex outermembrane recepter protein